MPPKSGDGSQKRDAAQECAHAIPPVLFVSILWHAILDGDASHVALSLEFHSRSQDRPMAQSLPLVAHGNVHWRKDDADWLSGVLGIYVD
jgi:hypothetical protein